MTKNYFLLMFFAFFSYINYSQVDVSVDVEEVRFLNTVSELDRSKFFNIHTRNTTDSDLTNFMNTHNAGYGRGFFSPFTSQAVGNYPSYTPGTTDNTVRTVSRFVSTDHPRNVMRYNADIDAAANWAVEYWLDRVNDSGRPEFWEPMNEPFVHSGDSEFSADQSDRQLVKQRMAEWFAGLGKKIKETPELANMKMVGYSSAWPSMERFDFGHWESNMKMFLDIAGQYMDAISVHTYDGVNVTGQDNRRSGSNSEAILDLIEIYTAEKFGIPKQLAITEFGIIESGYPDGYSEAESAISLKGINSMMFNFMEREDNVAIVIPFIVDKATWYYSQTRSTPYVPALFRPLNQSPLGNWQSTYKQNFYKLWSDVKGTRNFIQSDNPDIQVQSFVDGNKVYLALNNLDDTSKTINLNMLSGSSGITNVKTKSLKVFNSQDPSYTVTTAASLPNSITLSDGETVVIEVVYSSTITFTKTITRKKYYGSVTSTTGNPAFRINANVENTFQFLNVDAGTSGFAILRVGIGRPHTYVKLPSEIKVNGTIVNIPTNWKGYDQANRDEFFGVIEVPFSISLLNQGTNTVTVEFPDTGGKMSSLILSVEKRNGTCTSVAWYDDTDNDGLGDPSVSQFNCIRPQGFVSNSNDACPIDNINTCTIVHNAPGIIQAEEYTTQQGIQRENTTDTGGGMNIGFIEAGDYTEYQTSVSATGVYNVSFRVASDTQGGTITILSDGNSIGTVNIGNTGGWQSWQTVNTTVNLIAGTQNIRLVYGGGAGFLFNINNVEFSSSVLSTNDFDISALSIYPNPAKETIFISGLKESHTIIITDITGKILKTQKLSPGKTSNLDVSQLTPGLYLFVDKTFNSSYKFVKN